MAAIAALSTSPVTSSADLGQFKDSLKDKTNEDLVNMLGKNSGLDPAEKKVAETELLARLSPQKSDSADGAGGADGAGDAGDAGGDDEKAKLLKKLQDGTITEAELKELSGLLKVDVGTLEKIKGAAGGGNDTPDAADIQ